jgi:hypothetical protein
MVEWRFLGNSNPVPLPTLPLFYMAVTLRLMSSM